VEDAAGFPTTMAVIHTKALFSLDDVEMVIQIGTTPNELYDIVLPLPDSPLTQRRSGAA
jgi:hypothetical protein